MLFVDFRVFNKRTPYELFATARKSLDGCSQVVVLLVQTRTPPAGVTAAVVVAVVVERIVSCEATSAWVILLVVVWSIMFYCSFRHVCT